MSISASNPTAAFEDGFRRGRRGEHLTNPSVTDRSSAGIAQLATVLGYECDPEHYFAPTPIRVAFIKGYCAGYYPLTPLPPPEWADKDGGYDEDEEAEQEDYLRPR